MKADHTLDARGLYCPEPVMLLHGQIGAMQSGEILHVLATDPSTQRDIPKFCAFLGHELLDQYVDEGLFGYYIRKGQVS
ncbi:sulfurtransferase TusA [Neptuniibacter sp. CAU 1671]|uniref:sulfurtransferase TusA n=1 Tax=Neptuniibacter sp. CAU 1671 TaxID=3032593 RepID=UPI0023DAEE4F|nr:sulfurtransferase TusA [Neptuniibacter sp. CAU 1671]MDF2182900.1 sulfurtransferase TusA [Neptuniibacter sp. CAU 1671]